MIKGKKTPPDNEIWYTTKGDVTVDPSEFAFGKALAKSNVYEGGCGVITFDSPVRTIGEYAFSSTPCLESVILPDTVENIGHGAFMDCRGLRSVRFPKGLRSIGDSAFLCCASLADAYVPDGVEEVSCHAFLNARNVMYSGAIPTQQWGALTVNGYKEGVLFYADDSKEVLTACDLDAISVVIPGTVKTIGANAFDSCMHLASISIPDSVTKIGNYAFGHCQSLKSVRIPDSVSEVPAYAFAYCESLEEAAIGAGVQRIGISAFMFSAIKNIRIPGCVMEILSSAFEYCSSLEDVVIETGVSIIGDSAFCGCRRLKRLSIPETVNEIGGRAFWNCHALKKALSKSGKFYKCLWPGLICRDYHFKEGVVNELPDDGGEIVLCERGFHCCDNILSVFDYNYYGKDGSSVVLYEVEPLGKVVRGSYGHKAVCEKMRLVRRIPFSEIGGIVEKEIEKYCEKYSD